MNENYLENMGIQRLLGFYVEELLVFRKDDQANLFPIQGILHLCARFFDKENPDERPIIEELCGVADKIVELMKKREE